MKNNFDIKLDLPESMYGISLLELELSSMSPVDWVSELQNVRLGHFSVKGIHQTHVNHQTKKPHQLFHHFFSLVK